MKPSKNPPKNFESALSELEEITSRLEQGDAPLEEVMAIYERGAVLIQYCNGKLREVRGKIRQLDKNILTDIDDVGE